MHISKESVVGDDKLLPVPASRIEPRPLDALLRKLNAARVRLQANGILEFCIVTTPSCPAHLIWFNGRKAFVRRLPAARFCITQMTKRNAGF
jgi:hypothetical protein